MSNYYEKIKKNLLKSIKEIRLINEGELKGQPAREMINELKENRGGARQGAGRKSPCKPSIRMKLKNGARYGYTPTQN
jgi:hypothetical protein